MPYIRAERIYLSGIPNPSTIPIISGLNFFNIAYLHYCNDRVCYPVMKPPWAAGFKWLSKKFIPKRIHNILVISFIF